LFVGYVIRKGVKVSLPLRSLVIGYTRNSCKTLAYVPASQVIVLPENLRNVAPELLTHGIRNLLKKYPLPHNARNSAMEFPGAGADALRILLFHYIAERITAPKFIEDIKDTSSDSCIFVQPTDDFPSRLRRMVTNTMISERNNKKGFLDSIKGTFVQFKLKKKDLF
jgi:hypothetical protein